MLDVGSEVAPKKVVQPISRLSAGDLLLLCDHHSLPDRQVEDIDVLLESREAAGLAVEEYYTFLIVHDVEDMS